MTSVIQSDTFLEEEVSEKVPHWYCNLCNGLYDWPVDGYAVLVAYCGRRNPVEFDKPIPNPVGLCEECKKLVAVSEFCPNGHHRWKDD